jgi:hypothetical protein
MDLLSSKTILLGLIPVIGIGAGYFLLGPLKNMFKGKFGKQKTRSRNYPHSKPKWLPGLRIWKKLIWQPGRKLLNG